MSRNKVKDPCFIFTALADDPEDVGRRFLFFERILQLAELADVLDGDDGLGGEGFDKGDLVGTERGDLAAAEHDRPCLARRSPAGRTSGCGCLRCRQPAMSSAEEGADGQVFVLGRSCTKDRLAKPGDRVGFIVEVKGVTFKLALY